MLVVEIENSDKLKEIKDFISWAAFQLKLKETPNIRLSDDKNYVMKKRTFGTTHHTGDIWVYVGDRNTADILRTLCHELVHFKQFEMGFADINMSKEQHQHIEDVANAMAGRMLRKYGKQHVEIY